MTIREFYQSVINYASGVEMSCEEVDVLTTKAQELLVALDARNEKRKSADSKAKHETSARRETVCAYLSANPIFADDIASASGLSIGQVRSALSALVRDGIADKAEVKVGKSRKMAYTLHIGE